MIVIVDTLAARGAAGRRGSDTRGMNIHTYMRTHTMVSDVTMAISHRKTVPRVRDPDHMAGRWTRFSQRGWLEWPSAPLPDAQLTDRSYARYCIPYGQKGGVWWCISAP